MDSYFLLKIVPRPRPIPRRYDDYVPLVAHAESIAGKSSYPMLEQRVLTLQAL